MLDKIMKELKEKIKIYEQDIDILKKENNKLLRQTSGINEKYFELEMFQGLIEELEVRDNVDLKATAKLLKIIKKIAIIVLILAIGFSALVFLLSFNSPLVIVKLMLIFISVLNIPLTGLLSDKAISELNKKIPRYEHLSKVNNKLFKDNVYSSKRCKKMYRELEQKQMELFIQNNKNNEQINSILLKINELESTIKKDGHNEETDVREQKIIYEQPLSKNQIQEQHGLVKIKK